MFHGFLSVNVCIDIFPFYLLNDRHNHLMSSPISSALKLYLRKIFLPQFLLLHPIFELYRFLDHIHSAVSISNEINPYKIFEWITSFKADKIELKNLPYRFQKISENIINDSKSTNFHSLSYALNKANSLFENLDYAYSTQL